MSTGGATWETAGALTLGGANTFDPDDATSSAIFTDEGWWTFTVATPASVTLAVGPHTNFALYAGDDYAGKELVSSTGFEGDFDAGFSAFYLLTPRTYHLAAGTVGTAPAAYQVTYSSRPAATSSWISDLRDDPTNILTVVDLDDDWVDDIIRPGSYRAGDVGFIEELGGPWSSAAAECAIRHAKWGNQFSQTWDDICPALFSGPADLEIIGNSSVSYTYGEHTGLPFIADSTVVKVSTPSFGIWLKPVEENLPERGILAEPDPVDYGLPAEARIEYELDHVELIGLEIAERIGSVGSDPDTRFAVNHSLQPSFSGGEWGPWLRGNLPGLPPEVVPDWATGGNYAITFASEPVAFEDKTWHTLDVPDDGFDSLTQDYLNDGYDYGVVAGPAEAFGERLLDASRVAPVGLMLRVHVRSPRFRFIYDGPTTVVRQWPRDDVRGVSSAPRLWPPSKQKRLAGGYPGGSNA